MLKTVSVFLVFVFMFLSIASAFWYNKTPEQASEYIYNFDIQVVEDAFIRYEGYVRTSVDNVTSTLEDTKAFVKDFADGIYNVPLNSLRDFDFEALIDVNDGDITGEDIFTLSREFFKLIINFIRNWIDAWDASFELIVLLVKLLWYGTEAIFTGIVGIFDVLFTVLSLLKGAEGTGTPTIPDSPTIPVEPM